MTEQRTKVRRLEQPDDIFQDRCLVCFESFLTISHIRDMIRFIPKNLCNVIYSFIYPEYYPYCTYACYKKDIFNRCIECYSNLSDSNPRQYCGKRYCYQTWLFASHPEEVKRYFR